MLNVQIFSQKILMLRHKVNLRQKDVAEHCGVTIQAVSKWERGMSCPDIAIIDELADVLGVDINELFSNKNL